MRISFGYPRRLRLLSARDFRTVFDQVEVKAPSDLCLLLARFNSHDQPRLGFIISKKNIKRAVERNRIKRIARDYLRLHQYELPNLDIVFMGRKGLDKSSNEEIYQLLNKQFTKLKKRASTARTISLSS